MGGGGVTKRKARPHILLQQMLAYENLNACCLFGFFFEKIKTDIVCIMNLI